MTDTRAQLNRRRSAVIVGAFTALTTLAFTFLLALLGAGLLSVVIGLAVAAVWSICGWLRSSEAILDLSDAEPADEQEHSRVFNTTSGLCAAMGVTPPAVYVVNDPAINAMSIGTDPRNASIALTQGAVDELSVIELESVIALLLHRVKSGDIVPESIFVPTFGATLVLSEALDRWPLLSRLLSAPTPWLMRLLSWLHSAQGELDTDVAAVGYTRFPPGLASSLDKMTGRSALGVGAAVTAHLWIAPPLVPTPGGLASSVHAPLKDRVAVLQEL